MNAIPTPQSFDAARAAGAARLHAPGPRDEDFLALLSALRRHGGLAREAALPLRADAPGPSAPIRFEWGGAVWLPWFQFEPRSFALRPAVLLAASELRDALDDWALARWFAEPNDWLGRQRPVDRIDSDPAAVHAAARADRFVAHW